MNKKFDLKKLTSSREMSLVIVLVVLCAFIQLRNNTFLQLGTIEAMLKNYAVMMIMALGMMCVLLTGGLLNNMKCRRGGTAVYKLFIINNLGRKQK